MFVLFLLLYCAVMYVTFVTKGTGDRVASCKLYYCSFAIAVNIGIMYILIN